MFSPVMISDSPLHMAIAERALPEYNMSNEDLIFIKFFFGLRSSRGTGEFTFELTLSNVIAGKKFIYLIEIDNRLIIRILPELRFT